MISPGPRAGGSGLDRASVLVGIDDTDDLDSPGTGRLARMLVATFAELGLGAPLAATRHQLLVDPRIPYTSHNSSVCIVLDGGADPDARAITAAAAEFLERTSAAGSDPGLALATPLTLGRPGARSRLAAFGSLAKQEVLNRASARALADDLRVHLSAHGGDGGGIIGALAAVGLHCSGTDGRFLWMPRMREIAGARAYGELLAAVPIDLACDADGNEPAPDDLIELGDWVRPILRDGRAVLLLDPPRQRPEHEGTGRRWAACAKERVKSH